MVRLDHAQEGRADLIRSPVLAAILGLALSVAALASVIPMLLRFFDVPPDPFLLALSTAIFIAGLALYGTGPLLGLIASALLLRGSSKAAFVLFLFATVMIALTAAVHAWGVLTRRGGELETLLWIGICGGFVLLTLSARRMARPATG